MQQQPDTPLFPDVLWNRPLNKNGAGKLLIVGGNKFRFFAPAQAQATAEKVGVGVVKILLPDATKKLIGTGENNEFGSSNPSGSFSKNALHELLSLANWSDTVLLAGDAGHNSETSMVTEEFLQKYDGKVVITQDFIDMFVGSPDTLLSRENTLLVVSFSQLQKIGKHMSEPRAFVYSMSLQALLHELSDVSRKCSASFITFHQQNLIVATQGKTSYMKSVKEVWRVEQAAKSAVFWMQQPETFFETVTTSLLDESVISEAE